MARLYRNPKQVQDEFIGVFPKLANVDWCIKSPWDDDYQCVAWAECRTDRKSWPGAGYVWPEGLPQANPPQTAREDHFVQRFGLLGYKPCGLDRSFEIGYQKVAIYANDLGVTHMARQHFLGRGWLSKAGSMEDILHPNLEDIEGDTSIFANQYGKVTLILKRTWWKAFTSLSLFRCLLAAFKFRLHQCVHGYAFRQGKRLQ
jgi:hypothetical protein